MRPRPIDIDHHMEIISYEPNEEEEEEEELPRKVPVLTIEIPNVESLNVGRTAGYRRPEALIEMERETVPEVEYLIDGSDYEFLEDLNGEDNGSGGSKAQSKGGNKKKKKKGVVLSEDQFEEMMTKLERGVWDAQEEAHGHERQAAEGEDQELPFKLDDEPCGVCFQRHKSRKNYIVQCDVCEHSAHMACCIFQTVEKRKKWRCQGCADGLGYGKLPTGGTATKKSLPCSLCPFGLEVGVMMRTLDKKQWVHPRCAIWLGSALLGRKTVLKAIKLAPIRDNQHGTCYICKKKNQGALVKCDHEGCKLQFHVSCAPRKNCHLNMDNIYFVNRSLAPGASMREGGLSSPPGPHSLAMIEEGPARRGPKPSFKAYKKYNEISVNCSQFCSTHAPEDRGATLDTEAIWYKLREKISTFAPSLDEEQVAMVYDHWVDRRLENGKWGELPLLRSLEARRSAQRQEKKKKKKEQKRLTLPTGGLLHIPTDPVYNEMIQLRVEMDRARTIVDLLARRERLKKQLLQHDLDELAMEDWATLQTNLEEQIDVAELSTDKDADGNSSAAQLARAPPQPPAMVVALPRGLPPSRADIPKMQSRRRGRPRPPRAASPYLLAWPEDKENTTQKKRGRPSLASLEREKEAAEMFDEDEDDGEWANAKYKKKKKYVKKLK